MGEERIEELAEKYRLRTWHQIISTIGIPVIAITGPVMGWLVLDAIGRTREDIASLKARSDQLQIQISQNRTDIAVDGSILSDQERRVTALEDWRDRTIDGQSPTSNYRKR